MRILFAGTSEIGEQVLRTLVAKHHVIGLLTQPDRPAGRHRRLQAPAMKQLLTEIAPEIPILQPETLRDVSVITQLQKLSPDVMVTMSYGKILPPAILELPRLACLNIHVSLLPRHRGASPIQASIASGDDETGVTIMYMAEGLDTGDILLAKKIALLPNETAGSLTHRLSLLAPESLEEALELLAQNKAPRFSQDETLATFSHCITREDAFLNWKEPAVKLERCIRAMNPKPGAHGSLMLPSGKSISLKIFAATAILEKALSTEDLKNQQGSFFFSEEKSLLLRCGEGALLFHEVQPEGRSRMSFKAFARGQQLF